ncbi:tetratricopeptide repeat protein [Micromonospora sp. NBS 11-29]|uniref:tetratricopeptide repeat protein n=1 Tax=Micromonospora sp. NBS 11-29 TaxID=1960879 RepID=UPI001120C164|nr:tetratricopeptide repeat protein [Micromonospora sp. NBS 11-29]
MRAGRDAYVAERQYFGVDPQHPYFLETALPSPVPDLRSRPPSQLLTAQNRVVPFSNRDVELADFTAWRDSDVRHMMRLLHGGGGQGKTRLADRVFEDADQAGWRVLAARHVTDVRYRSRVAESDMVSEGRDRTLIVVDYADRWPLDDLALLVAETEHHFAGKIRILLLARSAAWWGPLRYRWQGQGWVLDHMLLNPIAESVGVIYQRALGRFAEILAGIDDIDPLIEVDFDVAPRSILSIHMSALAAVLAHLDQKSTPPDKAALVSSFLFDREQAYWEGARSAGRVTVRANTMSRAVFGAVLAGPMRHDQAVLLLDLLGVSSGTESSDLVLDDHGLLYPAVESPHVLEPLYPDRLAEDFVALRIPGGPADGESADPWVLTALRRIVNAQVPDEVRRRVLTLLVETSQRWPHVATAALLPLLADDPALAQTLGGAGILRLMGVHGIGNELLEAIDGALPRARMFEFDAARADLGLRLYESRTAAAPNRQARAEVASDLSARLGDAGDREAALRWIREAVAVLRPADSTGELRDLPIVAPQLGALSGRLAELDRFEESAQVAKTALELYRIVNDILPGSADVGIGHVLNNLSMSLRYSGDAEGAFAAVSECVAIRRRLVTQDARHLSDLAGSLDHLAMILSDRNDFQAALESSAEAVAIFTRLRRDQPDHHEWSVGAALDNRGGILWRCGKRDEAITAVEESVASFKRLFNRNRNAFDVDLYKALNNLAHKQWEHNSPDAAVLTMREAISLLREVASRFPVQYRPDLAESLMDFAGWLKETGNHEELIEVADEAVSVISTKEHLPADALDRAVGQACMWKSDALAATGRIDESFEAAAAAVVSWRRAARLDGEDLMGLANALRGLGARQIHAGHYENARRSLDEALEILRGLAGPAAESVELLGVTLSTFAHLQAESLSDPAAGLRAADESLSLLVPPRGDSIGHTAPFIVGSLESRAALLDALGLAEQATAARAMLSRFAEADVTGPDGIEPGAVVRGGADQHTDDSSTRPPADGRIVAVPDDLLFDDRAAAFAHRGVLLIRQGESFGRSSRWGEALAATLEAAEIFVKLSNKFDNVGDRRNLAITFSHAGKFLRNLRLHDEAIRCGSRSVVLWRSLAEKSPAEAEDLAIALVNLADALCSAGRPAEAIVHSVEAVEILRAGGEREGEDVSPHLCEALSGLAHHQMEIGDLGAAWSALNETANLKDVKLGEAAEVEGADLLATSGYLNGLAAELHLRTGDLDEARDCAILSMSAYGQYVSDDQTGFFHLRGALERLLRVLAAAGDDEEAAAIRHDLAHVLIEPATASYESHIKQFEEFRYVIEER